MKILFLSDGLFPFQLGGMQKHSTIVIRLLAERGHKLTVVHNGGKNFSQENLLMEFPADLGIEFILVPFPKFRKLPGHYIRENIAYSTAAFEEVKSNIVSFDLIYAQGFTGHAFLENRQKEKIQMPVIINLHGLEMFQFSADFRSKLANLLLRKEARFNLANADFVYSFGARITELLLKIQIPENKILEQSNGIEEDWIISVPKYQKVRTFVFIGRAERRKGFEEFLSAVTRLAQNEKIDFHVHHIGPIDTRFKKVSDKITWHGEIRDVEKIKSILDSCDCLVAPSYAEGMPTVILEAMARGLAIIATDVGAVCRLISQNGIILPSPVPNLIYAAMLQLIEMPEIKIKLMKEKSLELVKEKFLWSTVVDSIISDFNRITGKNI